MLSCRPQAIQGEVRARELEIDALTDRAEELSSACSAGRQSQHGQIIAKYQQVAQTVQVRPPDQQGGGGALPAQPLQSLSMVC